MLLGLGWPWWSARAERGEAARANPAPAAVRRKLRRDGVKRLSPESGFGLDDACGGRAAFLRFIRGSLDWARRAPGPSDRLLGDRVCCPGLGREIPRAKWGKGPSPPQKVGPLYHFARRS